MNQNLSFNTGTITLNIQGNASRQLSFNPNDYNLASRFFALIQRAEEKQKEFLEKAKVIDENDDMKSKLELLTEMDSFFRGEIDTIFGEGSATLIFEDLNLMTTAGNGDFVLANFLMALYPYFENASKSRVEKIIKEQKPKTKKK